MSNNPSPALQKALQEHPEHAELIRSMMNVMGETMFTMSGMVDAKFAAVIQRLEAVEAGADDATTALIEQLVNLGQQMADILTTHKLGGDAVADWDVLMSQMNDAPADATDPGATA